MDALEGLVSSDCTHARMAMGEALRRLPFLFDDEQREAIERVDNALAEHADRLAGRV